MDEENKIYSFLGLAAKANKIISGSALCENAIKKNKDVKMVIITKDATAGTMEKFNNICNKKSIRPILFGHKEELGNNIGKAGSRSVVCVTCNSFASRLKEMLLDE